MSNSNRTRFFFPAFFLAGFFLLAVIPVSGVSITESPDTIERGGQINITISDLYNGSQFSLLIDSEFNVDPGVNFNFEADNLTMPVTLNDGVISGTTQGTTVTGFSLKKAGGATYNIMDSADEDGFFSFTHHYTFTPGIYNYSRLEGTARSDVTIIRTTMNFTGIKQGPDDSEINFTVDGVDNGIIRLTVLVDGGAALPTKIIMIGNGVIPEPANRSRIGVSQDGNWALDRDGSFSWNAGDLSYALGGPGNTSVVGDWNDDNKTEIGVFSSGNWYLDYNGNGVYDGPSDDRAYAFGSAGFKPIVGDWNGDGADKIGVEANGVWAVDFNGNGTWDGDGTDRFAAFGQAGDIPVVGDWDGDGADEIGSHLDGFWAVDYNGNYVWDGTTDDRFAGLGQAADKPVIGDWNNDGRDEIGMETDGFWAVDYNGNYIWDGIGDDRFAGLGQAGDTPVVGDWNGDGSTEICSFTDGFWAVDFNGNYAWDGVSDDRFAGFGGAGATPVVGAWN